jgi:ribulose-phosphate 3-epimerase
MDGRFAPNISFGPAIVNAVRHSTAKSLNVHLMVVEPGGYLGDSKAGADHLLVQAEPSSTFTSIGCCPRFTVEKGRRGTQSG